MESGKLRNKGGIVSVMKNIILVLGGIVLLGLCTSAFAADLDGTWESEQPGRDGQTRKTTYVFQSNGSELTGKIITQRGDTPTETPISEGKIEGNNISFTTVRAGRQGGEMKITYKGVVSGDEITFTREFDFGGMAGPPGGGAGGPGGGMGKPPAGGGGGFGGGGAPPPIVAKRVK